MRQPSFAQAAKDILPDLDVPILLVWGEQDRMVPVKLAPMFAKMNHRLELIQLPKMGHCPHDENPACFNQILLSWLAKIER